MKQMESSGRFTPALRRLMSFSYDTCQSCEASLSAETPAYAGYDSSGVPLYVGDCCVDRVSELASYIYWWWQANKRCDPDTILWRYMDFAKFVALLESRALHFPRLDQLAELDKFEGAAGSKERQPEWDAHFLAEFRKIVSTVPGLAEPLPEAEAEKQAQRLLTNFNKLGASDRKRTYVSCWHANEGESEAFWRLYCPPPTFGIAIRSTVGGLLDSLGEFPNVEVGRVLYTDFRKGFAGTHDRAFWKRKSLSHEAEVRVIIRNFEPTDFPGPHGPNKPSDTDGFDSSVTVCWWLVHRPAEGYCRSLRD